MNKSELKNGCVVELRNGNRGIKIDNMLLIVRKNSEDMFGWLKLNDYNDDLTFANNDVAEYSTKEKALKALDMLEKHIMNCDLHNKVNFKFPKDDEVEE